MAAATPSSLTSAAPTSGINAVSAKSVPDVPGGYPEIKMFKTRLPAYGLYADKVDGLEIEGVKFSVAAGTVDLRPCFSFTADVKMK